MTVSPEVERANAMRWDMKKPGHYEVYYITLNHVKSGAGFWLRYTVVSPEEGRGRPAAQVWFAYFNYREPERNFAVRKKFPLDELRAHTDPFHLGMGDCEFSNGRVVGGLDGMGHEAFWDLNFTPSKSVHLYLPRPFYIQGLMDTVVICPNPNVRFNGVIRADGVKFDLKNEPGCQNHLWGRRLAGRWAWAHCGAFAEDPTAMFEGFCVGVGRPALPLPMFNFITINYRDKAYRFNGLRGMFSGRGSFSTGLWHFRAAAGNTLFRGEISCRLQDMVCAEYIGPDGRRVFCNNTETGSAVIQVFKRKNPVASWKPVETITSLATTNVEFASRAPDQRVKNVFEELP